MPGHTKNVSSSFGDLPFSWMNGIWNGHCAPGPCGVWPYAPELNSSPLNERVRLGGSCMTHQSLTQDSFL